MTRTGRAALTLAELDAMPIEEAQALPFDERDRLLDLIIADGRHDATASVSYRTGLYSDYFEEDLTRMLKVRAVTVHCRGTTSSNFDGVPVGETYQEQYRACFRHVETILTAARTNFGRVVKMVVFLTNMDRWDEFNTVYREFHSQPALPRRHRHHRSRPKAVAHRNSRMRRLPRRRLESFDNRQITSPLPFHLRHSRESGNPETPAVKQHRSFRNASGFRIKSRAARVIECPWARRRQRWRR